jgi:hypothetical protein
MEGSEEEDLTAAAAVPLSEARSTKSVVSSDTSQSTQRSSKVDRRSLRTVKRNLLSCYDEVQGNDSDAQAHVSTSVEVARPHAAGTTPLRAFAENREAFSAPRAHPTRHPLRSTAAGSESPGFESGFAASTEGTRAWTDVDLSKWATVSKVAVSPVVRGTLASPMPVVLPHRILQHQPAASRGDEDSILTGSLLDDAAEGDAHLDSALCLSNASSKAASMDMELLRVGDHDIIGRSLSSVSRDTELAARLPHLNLSSIDTEADVVSTRRGVLTSVPESPGAEFDSAAEREAQEGDAALLRIIIKVLSGARHATPLTSRYCGNDPELLFTSAESMRIEALAAACVKGLPLSCVCEGRQLLEDFEELPIPLYETVAHNSADLMRFAYAKDASFSSSSSESPPPYRVVCLCVERAHDFKQQREEGQDRGR